MAIRPSSTPERSACSRAGCSPPCAWSSDLDRLRRHLTTSVALGYLGALGALGSSAPAWARGPTVWLALPERGGIFEEAALALRAALAQLNPVPDVQVALWDELRPDRDGVPALIVAMGTPALRGLLGLAAREPARRAWPMVAALVPKSSFDTSPPPPGMRVSAAFLDQPLARYATLIQLALPDRPRVGVVLGPASVGQREALSTALAQRGLSLADSALAPGSGPDALFPALSDVLQRSDILLALPDPQVVSAASLQNLLIAAYRQRKPVVSFAASHVRAGAGLALYTTPRQSAVQAAAMAGAWLTSGNLPAPQFATSFEVSTNERVLRSLGLPAPDPESLTRRLREQEPER